jgi:hypothetical protein
VRNVIENEDCKSSGMLCYFIKWVVPKVYKVEGSGLTFSGQEAHEEWIHRTELNRKVFGFEPFWAWCTQALGQALYAPCSITKLEEPCSISKFPDGPYI